jgi:hypothetical protein
MDDDPEIRNAMNLVIAIPVLASSAAMIALVPPDVLTFGLLLGADSSVAVSSGRRRQADRAAERAADEPLHHPAG